MEPAERGGIRAQVGHVVWAGRNLLGQLAHLVVEGGSRVPPEGYPICRIRRQPTSFPGLCRCSLSVRIGCKSGEKWLKTWKILACVLDANIFT